MKIILCYLTAMMLVTTTHAVGRSDFAYGYNLEVDGDGAIYSLNLPADVYQGMVRADHGDIRVFNSHGDVVPYVLRRDEQTSTTVHAPIAVPIFPLYGTTDSGAVSASTSNLHITTNEQGSVIDINYGKTDLKTQKLSGYLLDLSEIDTVPNALQVQWPENQTDFVIAVHVEASDDLNHWRSLVASSTLSRLQYGAHQLIQDKIELPLHKVKYLRLGWNTTSNVSFDKIMAQFPATVAAQARVWHEMSANPQLSKDNNEQIYNFDAQGYFPIDRIAVQFSQHNSVIQSVIESADSQTGPWHMQYQGLLYDLMQSGTVLSTPTLTIPHTTERWWRIRVVKSENSNASVLTLKLGWIPEQLLFAAQGESPFTLAFGSGRVVASSSMLDQVLQQDGLKKETQLIKPARLGARVSLGDMSRLQPAAPPTPWKKWILWAVLVVGVIILATMAYRLVRQLNQSNTTSSNE